MVPSHTPPVSLVELLGEQRAAVVDHLRREPGATIAELADVLGVSEVATRRHIAILEEREFVAGQTVEADGPGRPATTYRLTDRARALFPQRYAAVASELIEFISSEHGRDGLRDYLRWRLDRETDSYRDVVDADDLGAKLHQLAEALSEAGYDAEVREEDGEYVLEQGHCAIYDVAKHHPEMCAYEAATFSKVLGRDVTLSRRQTIAAGATACVCNVTPKSDHDS